MYKKTFILEISAEFFNCCVIKTYKILSNSFFPELQTMPCGTTKAEVAINNPAEYVVGLYVCSLHPPNITLSLQSSYRIKIFRFL